MTKNVPLWERWVRVVVAIVAGLLAILINAWPTWLRIVSGAVGVILLITAVVGY